MFLDIGPLATYFQTNLCTVLFGYMEPQDYGLGSGLRILGFRVEGLGWRVEGLGFRVGILHIGTWVQQLRRSLKLRPSTRKPLSLIPKPLGGLGVRVLGV